MPESLSEAGLVAQVLYFLFSKSKSIKFTIGSLCLLAFVVSFGPWGMLGVSQRSQVGRLEWAADEK